MSDNLPSLALLAGGLATRMYPVTKTIPKSMLEVAGEPFIAHQLRLFKREGIKEIVICAGYLAEQIIDYVGDGGKFGVNVQYSLDGDKLLKTGGAIKKALPILGGEFFVMYGDSYLDIDFTPVFNTFKHSNKAGLMTVLRNKGKWDTSNIEFRNGNIIAYDKINLTDKMEYIDYGLGILKSEIFKGYPDNKPFDLAELYSHLVDKDELVGYETSKRFYEIGSKAGLEETDQYITNNKSG